MSVIFAGNFTFVRVLWEHYDIILNNLGHICSKCSTRKSRLSSLNVPHLTAMALMARPLFFTRNEPLFSLLTCKKLNFSRWNQTKSSAVCKVSIQSDRTYAWGTTNTIPVIAKSINYVSSIVFQQVDSTLVKNTVKLTIDSLEKPLKPVPEFIIYKTEKKSPN